MYQENSKQSQGGGRPEAQRITREQMKKRDLNILVWRVTKIARDVSTLHRLGRRAGSSGPNWTTTEDYKRDGGGGLEKSL